MDAIELLAREDEFQRLNKQLEKKTDSLMREIEHVMQKQDFFSVFSPSLSPSQKTTKKHCCTPPTPEPVTPLRNQRKKNSEPRSPNRNRTQIKNETQNRTVCDCCPTRDKSDMEFLYAFVSVNVKDKASQCEGHLTQLAEFESERAEKRGGQTYFRTSEGRHSTHDTRGEIAISRLQSQIKTLTSRIDKQAALIDNLRKQNLILATDGAVKCLERDYCNFLNQDL
ncbi:Uncharacterized protein OBRU01_19300 [Operophtera brumata]|uniref:Uncharacterized protein n=1 Tax=Operophtera brumata TaxID=104452 RepID=A0A0L7KXM7_OPEBR|nr:Uncharacterized protein OBRU01_19300 [Operophtera brumata]